MCSIVITYLCKEVYPQCANLELTAAGTARPGQRPGRPGRLGGSPGAQGAQGLPGLPGPGLAKNSRITYAPFFLATFSREIA